MERETCGTQNAVPLRRAGSNPASGTIPPWILTRPRSISWAAEMNRLEKKLFRIADRLQQLSLEEKAVREELDMHRSINEDAQADAAIGNYIDREEAGLTRKDVERFEKSLASLRARREKLEATRLQLLDKLTRR